MKTRRRTRSSPYFADRKYTDAAKREDSEAESSEKTKTERRRRRKRMIKEEPKEAEPLMEPVDEASDPPAENSERKRPKRHRYKKSDAEVEDQKPQSRTECRKKASAEVHGEEPQNHAKRRRRTPREERAQSAVDNIQSDGSATEWEDVENTDFARPSTSGRVDLLVKTRNTSHETSRLQRLHAFLTGTDIKEEDKKHFSLIRRYLNRIVKIRRENTHQILLLCFLAHGRYLSKSLSESSLEERRLVRLIRWFHKKYSISPSDPPVGSDVSSKKNLCRIICNEVVISSQRDYAMVFVSLARSLGMQVRLVVSLSSKFLRLEADASADGPSLVNSVINKLSRCKTERRDEVSGSAEQPSPTKESGASSSASSETLFQYWPEVYLSSVGKWHCKQVVDASPLYSCEPLESTCSNEMAYCLSFDNEHMAKDLTLRYATDSAMLKYRQWRLVDNWWIDVLRLFRPVDSSRDEAENELIERQLVERPLPRKISDYKNHPLYVLERDLLKFQALYPKDVQPIGYCSKVPVYRRSAVRQLNGKEVWIREARVIKENEEPYKIVKARPKMNVPPEERVDRPLFLYGIWQTEPYVPPTAADGIVPKNKFGNVELYQMKMLPKGTVYLDVPGVLEVARRLDIDCVPAVVGWEFHCRTSHPVLKGFVVCEEFKDILMDAWREERVISVQREKERKSKRAIQNWRRLIRGLLIKSSLAKNFPVKEEVAEVPPPSTSFTQPLAWPQCRQDFTFEGSLSD